jgi:hypothetical protein
LRDCGFVELSYPVTRDEHKAIIEFIERTVNGAQPPMDVEADAIIRALFKRNPDAAYRITMLAMSLTGRPPNAHPADLPRQKGWLGGLFDNRREVLPVQLEPVTSWVAQGGRWGARFAELASMVFAAWSGAYSKHVRNRNAEHRFGPPAK